MLPHTRMFLDAVREEEEPPMLQERGSVERADDPGSVLMLKLRKKQQLAMMKRIYADAGYPELARMVSMGHAPEAEEDYR